jgi:hypothetical protein
MGGRNYLDCNYLKQYDDEHLLRYLEGSLGRRSNEVKDHMRMCRDCSREMYDRVESVGQKDPARVRFVRALSDAEKELAFLHTVQRSIAQFLIDSIFKNEL